MASTTFPVLWKDSHEHGIKGIVDVDMKDLSLKSTRLRDLFPVLNTVINAQCSTASSYREVERLLLYGTCVGHQRSFDALIPELENCPRFVAIMRVHPKKVVDTRVKIYVKTLTEKSYLVNCRSTDTVCHIKSRIMDKERIAVEKQQLVYAGKCLENHLTLNSYGIQAYSRLYMVKKMFGGGLPPRIFADVSDNSLLIEREFSRDAPDWRIAYRGLNIEGKCNNEDCVAYRRMIIYPKRYEAFNLMRDDDIRCPMCQEKVKPRTCGFYDCYWKFDGVQSDDGFSLISKWKDAFGRKYHRFNTDKKYGSVEWESLLIVAKPREESVNVVLSPSDKLVIKNQCTICWCQFGSMFKKIVTTVGCGHSFHDACIDKWVGWCEKSGVLTSCPCCRTEVQISGKR
ncbi:putative Ubiquitin domain, Zinc finger, RING-type, Zinc finger, RING/FYVE/PHD-type [Plasmopara halstedii]